MRDITALVINYRTFDLTKQCVESLLYYYPDMNLLLIDNGSHDNSTEYIRDFANRVPHVRCQINPQNRYHGPSMDEGIRSCTTHYVFTLDSDCEIKRGGFLEQMLLQFQAPNLYAIGSLSFKNRYGFTIRPGARYYVRYIDPHAMLLDAEKYRGLEPFFHHGAPCIKNMKDAERSGLIVQDFPVQNFIYHAGRGTSGRYGYGLGPMTFVQKVLSENLPDRASSSSNSEKIRTSRLRGKR